MRRTISDRPYWCTIQRTGDRRDYQRMSVYDLEREGKESSILKYQRLAATGKPLFDQGDG